MYLLYAMLLMGIDIGTSFVKVAVVDAATQQTIASTSYPEKEAEIISSRPGWAEQSPDLWWEHTQQTILKLHSEKKYDPWDIAAIGIAYQMHGLVMVNKDQRSLRNSIIWCDSRAVEIGEKAFAAIGTEKCLHRLLNSPGNFTASKLAWVKQNEPDLYAQTEKIMLPGDFIAMKLTGNITTSMASLSEGMFWDFQENKLSEDIFTYYGFDTSLIPELKDVFAEHGRITAPVASALSLKEGIPVSYKAGDQPNNAFSLNVLLPGEVAATAGTSGVIYGVNRALTSDPGSRVNSFAHVNHTVQQKRIGELLCINGTGISYNWIKNIAGHGLSYLQMNDAARQVKPGSGDLLFFPFGNGAERMLQNRIVGASFANIDLNKHSSAHIFRAAQEGVAFAFRYGLDILKENGMNPGVIRAGKANMFLSEVFTECFVNTLNVPVELYNSDGSRGAAIGAGIGAKIFHSPEEAFRHFKPVQLVEPENNYVYDDHYNQWKEHLQKIIGYNN